MSDDIKIVGFLCNWCCYGGADTAGTSRLQYPPSVRIIRVMCSGRVDPSMVFKAFEEGADGVFVGGCHIGDCHYESGNYKWSRRAKLTQDIIEELLGGLRSTMTYIGARKLKDIPKQCVFYKVHNQLNQMYERNTIGK